MQLPSLYRVTREFAGRAARAISHTESTWCAQTSLPPTDVVPEPTPFWERKIGIRFSRMDVNKDGYVDEDDLERLVTSISSGHSEGTAQHLREVFESGWTRIWSYGMHMQHMRVSRAEFLRGYTHTIKSTRRREALRQTLNSVLGECFDAFDESHHDSPRPGPQLDGEVITEDPNTVLSKQSYMNAAWDFYFSMQDRKPYRPGTNFYGIVRSSEKKHLTF